MNSTNEKKEEKSYHPSFYALAGAFTAGIFGSLYYLYNLYSYDELENNESLDIQIKKIKKLLLSGERTEFSLECAVKIVALVNRLTDEIVNKKLPGVDKRRRENFNNPDEYDKICYDYLNCKEDAFKRCSNTILTNINLTHDEFQKRLEAIKPWELGSKLYEYEQPIFDEIEEEKVDPNMTKTAFFFYGNKFMEDVVKFHQEMLQLRDPPDQGIIMFRLEIIKTRVDDELYFKYGINELQMRYLLHKHNLNEDKDVRMMHDKLKRFE